MGTTYSYLDKELTKKYKNKIIITNDTIFMSTNTFKSTLDTNRPWKRYYGVYGKKFPETIPILFHKEPNKIFKPQPLKSKLLTIKRIEYVTIYTGPDSCRDDREYNIFAKDQHNNTYEISNLFKDVNTIVKPDEIIHEIPHIKPQFQKFMTGRENKFMFAMFPIHLECKEGISFK